MSTCALHSSRPTLGTSSQSATLQKQLCRKNKADVTLSYQAMLDHTQTRPAGGSGHQEGATHIKDDKVEEDEDDVDDDSNDQLQLAHYCLGVLQQGRKGL